MASKRTRSNPIKVIDKLDPRVKTKEYRTRTSDYDVERQVATLTAPNYVSSTEDSFKNTKHNFRLILGHREDFSDMRDIMDSGCITLTELFAHPDRVMAREVRKAKFTSDMSMEDIRFHLEYGLGGHELAKELRRRGKNDYIARSQATSVPKPVTLLHMMWETIIANNYGRDPLLLCHSYLNAPLTRLFSLIRGHLDPQYAVAIYKLLNAIRGLEGSMDGLQFSIAESVNTLTGTDSKSFADYVNNGINSFMVRKGYSGNREQAIIDAMALCELTKDDRPILLNSKQIDNESFARICQTYGHDLTDKQLQSIKEDVYEHSRNLADRYNTLLRAAYNMLVPCIYGSVIPVSSQYKIITVDSEIVLENTPQSTPRV